MNGSTSFSLSTFNIQPADASTFPWGATIAKNYSQYRLRGCVFMFRSTSADDVGGAGDTALGTVMMCHDQDPLADAPANKQELLSYMNSTDTKPSLSKMCIVECAPHRSNAEQHMYIRPGPLPTGGNLKDYDFGKFYLATEGQPAAVTKIGELWVTYEFELIRPKLDNSTPTLSSLLEFDAYESGDPDKNDVTKVCGNDSGTIFIEPGVTLSDIYRTCPATQASMYVQKALLASAAAGPRDGYHIGANMGLAVRGERNASEDYIWTFTFGEQVKKDDVVEIEFLAYHQGVNQDRSAATVSVVQGANIDVSGAPVPTQSNGTDVAKWGYDATSRMSIILGRFKIKENDGLRESGQTWIKFTLSKKWYDNDGAGAHGAGISAGVIKLAARVVNIDYSVNYTA